MLEKSVKHLLEDRDTHHTETFKIFEKNRRLNGNFCGIPPSVSPINGKEAQNNQTSALR